MQMCDRMKKTGFYVIKDQFFLDMNEPYLKGNKEGNRPHYYCFEDAESGVYWMIPLSSRVEKYRAILNKRLAAGKPCDTLYIAKLDNDRESAFLIQDIFSITENYIEREYAVAGNPMMLTSEHVVSDVEKRARKIVGLLKRGFQFTPTQPNVLRMLELLKAKKPL